MQQSVRNYRYLISEFRRRVEQLHKVKDEDLLIFVEKLSRWFLNRKEFSEAIKYADSLEREYWSFLESYRQKFNKSLFSDWNQIKKIAKIDKKKGLAGNSYEILKITTINEITIDSLNAYHYLRYIKEYLWNQDKYKKILLSRKMVKITGEGQIVDFSSDRSWNLWQEYSYVNDKLVNGIEDTFLWSLGSIRQLVNLKVEVNWRNQFKSWKEIYGKEYYISRLFDLSNYIYDFYILNTKPIYKLSLSSSDEINDVEYKIIDNGKRFKLELGKYGSVTFEPEKSSSTDKLIRKFIETLLKDKNGSLFDYFLTQGFSVSQIDSYVIHVNNRFKSAFTKMDLKVVLTINKENVNSLPMLILHAYKHSIPSLNC